jgi:adenosylcobinamide-phosphate synthase
MVRTAAVLRRRAAAAGLGVLADRALGEPPFEPHPVAGFGAVMQAVEGALWRDRRGAGVVHAALGAGLGLAAGRAVGSTAVSTYVAVAGRGLADAAHAVGDALAVGDLDQARRRLPALVGRDPSHLDEAGIARAVVESVAENTVDAVVAPALWAVAGGAPGALVHRAVNTLDAMVGHRTTRHLRYGWASARLDDAMAWVPARATAGLVVAARPSTAGAVVRAVRDDAPAHPSPNAGVAEAAFAAALGLRLGGPVAYGDDVVELPAMGRGRPPAPSDIGRAVRLADHVGLALATALLAPAAVRAAAGAGRPRRRGRAGGREA